MRGYRQTHGGSLTQESPRADILRTTRASSDALATILQKV